MQMLRRSMSWRLLSIAGSSPRSSGAPLLRKGGDRRHLLCLPHEHRLWLPESFRGGPSTAGGQILSMNGVGSFAGSEAEMIINHFNRRPLLHDVPTNRLMLPNPPSRFFLEDDGNHGVRSGMGMMDFMHQCGLSSKGLWTKENVMVLPSQMRFAFKEVDLGAAGPSTIVEKVDECLEFFTFLVDCIKETQGSQAAQQLPPALSGLQTLANEVLKDPLLVELLIDNAALLPIQSKGLLYKRAYNLLIQRLPCLDKYRLKVVGFVPTDNIKNVTQLLTALLAGVPYGPTSSQQSSQPLWGTIAQANIDVFKCMTTQTKMGQNNTTDFVTMLRVGASHPLEKKLAMLIAGIKAHNSPSNAASTSAQTLQGSPLSKDMQLRAGSSTLPTNPPSCREILQLMDGTYPDFPTGLARSFWKQNVYKWLDIRGLFGRLP